MIDTLDNYMMSNNPDFFNIIAFENISSDWSWKYSGVDSELLNSRHFEYINRNKKETDTGYIDRVYESAINKISTNGMAVIGIDYSPTIRSKIVEKNIKCYVIERSKTMKNITSFIDDFNITHIVIPVCTDNESFASFEGFIKTFARSKIHHESSSFKVFSNHNISLLYRAFINSDSLFNITKLEDYQELYNKRSVISKIVSAIYIPSNHRWILDSIRESVEYEEYQNIDSVDDGLMEFDDCRAVSDILDEVITKTRVIKLVSIYPGDKNNSSVCKIDFINIPYSVPITSYLHLKTLIIAPSNYSLKVNDQYTTIKRYDTSCCSDKLRRIRIKEVLIKYLINDSCKIYNESSFEPKFDKGDKK